MDEVFGTHVVTDDNSDWLNVYANYSLADRQVCDTLDLILHREEMCIRDRVHAPAYKEALFGKAGGR